jgi:hypothetical protein
MAPRPSLSSAPLLRPIRLDGELTEGPPSRAETAKLTVEYRREGGPLPAFGGTSSSRGWGRRLALALFVAAACVAPLNAQAFQIHRDSSAAGVGGAPVLRRQARRSGAPRGAAGLSGGGRSLPQPGVFGPRGRATASPSPPKAR